MTPSVAAPAQSRLAELHAERVEWVTGASPGPDAHADTVVLVVLRSFAPADVVHGARDFAASLEAHDAAAWRRSWTRTRFLFGNPANLTPGNRARVIAPGATTAWLGPFPDNRRPGLSRLLKPVTGELPSPTPDIDVAGTGAPRTLHIAVEGLTLVDYLVHLHHTVAEAVLGGRMRPDEPVRLRHLPMLGADLACGSAAYARVTPEPGDTDRLRLHTWLC